MKILLNASGIFVFIFFFWKKLKDDYVSNQIFSSSLLIILGIGIFFFISKFYISFFWFWFCFFGFLAGLFLSVLKFRLRIYETFEAALIAVLPWLAFTYLEDSILNTSLYSLLGFIVTLGAFVIYKFLNSRYKNFSWYKSGRVGFAGLTSIGLYFLIRGLVAIFFPFVLSFVGNYEPILSGIAAFAFFSLVFNLSRI